MEIKISAIIITHNEEQMIEGCLKSISWVNKIGEILLVDNGSTDNTYKIAKKYGAKIIRNRTGKNFSDWRNLGAKEAHGEWLFYVDADERITDESHKEMLGLLDKSEYSVFAIPRRNFVLGKELKHGGFWPDYQRRIFKKVDLVRWKGELHEQPIYKGELYHLKEPMIHDKHETLFEMVEKTNKWSNIEGKLMFDAGHPPMNVIRFCTAMFREFWTRMVKGRAFLDGKVGIIFAFYQVFSRFVSYAKLWEMQLKSKK